MRTIRPRRGRWPAAVTTVAAAILAVTATAVTPAYAEGEIRNAHHPDAIPGSYLVVYADDEVTATAASARTRDLAARYRATVDHTYQHALRGFAGRLSERVARRLAAEPGVAYVAQNATVRVTGTQPNPPSWGLNRIDQRNLPLDTGYTYPSTAPTVTAYIIDTGIRTTHSDFGGRAVWGTNTVDSTNTDCNGHGTHVAGTVGGAAYGVAKGVRLVAVKVLNCAGSGSFAAVAAGVDWVTGHHVSGPAVANMSLGGSGSDATVENAVRRSIADGVVYAIASGNSSSDACNFTPARVAEAITVNASDSADNRASFSNYGTCTDIFAPGVGITSAWSSGDTATNTISGTSMAAPHVAGAAALLLAGNPGLTPAQVASTMYGNATPNKITNPGGGSPNRLLFVAGGTPDTVQVTDPGSQSTRRNVATSLPLSASGGTAPYTWSATGLPAGLSINPTTGLVSGTPTTAATYTVTVTARDAANRTGSTAFSWVVTENLDNTWACSVPAGYTYDRVTNDLNRCNPGGWAYTYRLRAPADAITTCSVPAGFTYDRVTNDLSVCSPSSFAYSYRIRVPVVGLWACSVPAGFSYSQYSNQLSVCNPSGFAYSYLLSR